MKIRQWFSNGAGRNDAAALSGADGALSFDDWRDSLFPERDFMVKETHARTGYPLPRYARVSHMTRLFPSREDEFRYALMQKLRPGEVATVERSLSSPSPRERRKAAQDWFATVSGAIGALGLDDGGGETQERRIAQLAEALSEMRRRRTVASLREDTRRRALEEIAKLDDLFEHGGPLRAQQSDVEAFRSIHPTADIDHFRPYKPTGQSRFRWYNLWKLDGAPSPERRLRMNWEMFGASQNFTVYEDFRTWPHRYEGSLAQTLSAAPDGRQRSFLSPSEAPGSPLDPNLEWTALDTLESEFASIASSSDWPGFKWTGHLMVAAHYWILPIDHVLNTIEKEHAEEIRTGLLFSQGKARLELDLNHSLRLAQALQDLAARLFRYPDKTAYGAPRKDFVISRISNGQAILISDLRPTDRSAARGEMATQAIILDIALTSEERGRVVRRCADIGSARTLAFRDFPYVDAMTTAINGIGRSLDRCNSEILDVANRGAAGLWDDLNDRNNVSAEIGDEDRRTLAGTLKRLRQLSVNLSTLNAFITHGISGAFLASRDYRRMVEERLKSLEETPIGGFQTLGSFLSRFFNTSDTIDRMATRYDTLRRRVAEYSQVVRTEIELKELNELQTQAKQQVAILERADVLGAIGVFLGLLTAYLEHTDSTQRVWWDAVVLAGGAVGLLTALHFIWKRMRRRGGVLSPGWLRFIVGAAGLVGFVYWALARL